MASVNFKLYVICFLDALSMGFILPILATHIISLGGTHTTLGILATYHAAFQLISGPLVRSWRDVIGEKAVLLFTLFINFATYLPLGLTTSYFIILGLRLIFGVYRVAALTNQTQTLCKAILSEQNPPEQHDSIYNVMNAVTVAGFVMGPIVGGSMFDSENGFYHITMLATLMITLCLLIGLTLPSSTIPEKKDETTTLIQKIKEDVHYSLSSLKSVKVSEQWDVLLLKCMYHASITVFFIKFSLLLRFHYNASSTTIGYTYAYQSILTFFSHFIITLTKQKFAKTITNLISSLFVVTIAFLGLCYASTYDAYLVSFIPMILAHTLVTSNWKELFKLRSTKECNIEKAEETVAKVMSVITPVIFGMFCDLYGHYALKAFVILPLIFDIFIAIVFKSDTVPVVEISQNEKRD